ncbi:hypothetical protein [Streptomyces sp. NPDC094472]|uniref:hypothetical protein n=1 Tax=Streptomyces sp. NPDC094472 TaxID=3155080 RepID=UPI00331B3781
MDERRRIRWGTGDKYRELVLDGLIRRSAPALRVESGRLEAAGRLKKKLCPDGDHARPEPSPNNVGSDKSSL